MKDNNLYNEIEVLKNKVNELESVLNDRGLNNFFKKALSKLNVVTGVCISLFLTSLIAYAAQITFSEGDWISASEVNNNFNELYSNTSENRNAIMNLVPVGTILAWHKSMEHTPQLPDGWAECNGSPVDDDESPYDGLELPDLNNPHKAWNEQGSFLRGGTSSGLFDDDSFQAHGHSMGTIDDDYPLFTDLGSSEDLKSDSSDDSSELRLADLAAKLKATEPTKLSESDPDVRYADETKPVNMTVVWIIKIK